MGVGDNKVKPFCPTYQPLCLIIIFFVVCLLGGNLVFVDDCRSRCYDNDKIKEMRE